MKHLTFVVLSAILAKISTGQISGNLNYMHQVRFPDNNIEIDFPPGKNLVVTVKGMANVKADSYVAIFSVTQSGKTTEEVNGLMDTRINQALDQIKKKANTEALVDMVSFVPVYEYETDKKLFSKKTYNEVPTGFELKKNIHVKYSNPNDLHSIITILTGSEIYDLVRVDYFSNNLETIKKDLMTKAKTMMQEKLKTYQQLLNVKLDSLDKQITDGYKAFLPVEMYKSYQAYNSTSLNVSKAKAINQADKSTTLYYQPIVDKEFDFVVNPMVFEPAIQVMYEIKLSVLLEKQKPAAQKEFILLTPSGEMKNISLGTVKN